MRLSHFLLLLGEIAYKNGYAPPYIVGGVPRDRSLGIINKLNDIDLTTGDDSIHYLAKEISLRLKGPGVIFRTMDDGHSRLILGDLKLDFSSNFKIPGISKILQQKGVNHPSSLVEELYSRDFTCNSLLMPMDLSKIEDLLGVGKEDIADKVLRTCLTPELTLGHDPKRLPRLLYLAAKLQFAVDTPIIDWVLQHPQVCTQIKPDYWTKKLKKAFELDTSGTLALIRSLQIAPYLPRSPILTPYYSQL